MNQYRKDEDAVQIYGTEKFHLKFGFSNKMFSLAYLIRLEPFTDSFIQVNKSLDNPDRIMYSIGDQYHSVETDPQNNSELTPEFFYFPEILRNHNLSHFGRNRDGVCVNEVILPSWCANEHDFIRINREILDSKIVTAKLPYWLDMIYGAKQAKEECLNIFYCYAYESHVGIKTNRDQMEPANIETIKEFMQVPFQIFRENLSTEKNFKVIGGYAVPSVAIPQSTQIIGGMPIDSESEDPNADAQKGKVKQEKPQSGFKKFLGFKPQNPVQSRHLPSQPIASASVSTMNQRNQGVSSLIRRFIDKPKPKDQEINNICEEHKISDSNRQVVHMILSLNKCLVFVADRFQNEGYGTGYISVAGCRESFSQEELKPLCNLGLRIQNLKGDLSTIFQYTLPVKNAQKFPLIYSCQNLDNTIKVFDLNVKKGLPYLVYQESLNNNVVNVIKFSNDLKYFITGDQDGVIHHYCRETEDVYEYQSSALASSAPMPKFELKNPAFPYILKYKIQDHMSAIIGIDMNMTLDMYCTASTDGNLFIRCLRTSQLWKVIPVNYLMVPHIQVISLKMSLHGYIILVLKAQKETIINVYSLNGDILSSQVKKNDVFELKYVQLNQAEDHLIWVINRKQKSSDTDWNGQIRYLRLYDLEIIENNLELSFYPILSSQYLPSSSSRSVSSHKHIKSSNMMPLIRCFTMNQDESKLNLFLSNQLIYCFDESKEQIIRHLDDFGLT